MSKIKWILYVFLALFVVQVSGFDIEQADESGNINQLTIGVQKTNSHGGSSADMTGIYKKRTSISRSFVPFDGLIVSVPCQLNYQQSPLQNVRIEAERDVLEALTIDVIGKHLVIDTKKGFSTQSPIKIWVSSASLRTLKLDGVTDANLTRLSGKQLAITVAGATDLVGEGVIDSCGLVISGASNVDMQSVKCKDVRIAGEGSADISVHAGTTISGSLAGAVDLNIFGNPGQRELQSFGAVDIKYH